MRLLIEDGILLKEYALAWSPDGFSAPPAGWTPDEHNSWVLTRAVELLTEAQSKELVTTLFFTRTQAAKEYGAVLFKKKKPWSGWVPITSRRDKRISKAYRRYFVELKQRPPDGFYELRNGKMYPGGNNER